MKNYVMFMLLLAISMVFVVLQKEMKTFSYSDSNQINLKLKANNNFYIDGNQTTISKIKVACRYGGCKGPEPIVHLFLEKSVSIAMLDSIENELRNIDVLRINYHKI